MSVSYMVREEFNVQSAIWAIGSAVYHTYSFTVSAYRIAAKALYLLLCTVEMLAVMAWKGKPSAATPTCATPT